MVTTIHNILLGFFHTDIGYCEWNVFSCTVEIDLLTQLLYLLTLLLSYLQEHQISLGDFPKVAEMQEKLAHQDFTKFHVLKPRLIETVDRMLAEDIARLMQMIPLEDNNRSTDPRVKGGAFDGVDDSPFGVGIGEGIDKGRGEGEWVVSKDRYKYDEAFESLNPIDGKVTGAAAKSEMVRSRLPNSTLGKIWKLSDIDRDGMLDSDEFALAMHLVNIKLEGHDLPNELPDHLVPPSKKGVVAE